METKTCSVEGCDAPAKHIGLCLKHYTYNRNHTFNSERTCSVDGCSNPQHGQKLCQKHYARKNRHGSTDDKPRADLKPCSVEGCDSPSYDIGLCGKHAHRMRRHGDTDTRLRNANGEGGISSQGYRVITVEGKRVLEHIAIAERALSKPLPKGAQVHHIDGDKLNNAHSNLIVLPSAEYHARLHVRMKAREECGDPDKRKCYHCHKYDNTTNMKQHGHGHYHRQCDTEYKRKSK